MPCHEMVTDRAPDPFGTATTRGSTLPFDNMSFRWLPMLLLAACGRIGFDGVELVEGDAASCASAVGHDEDADGIDDACDLCPQTADVAQADRDGDRVGDACDPHPDDPRDQIAVFDPFTSLDPAWNFRTNPPTVTGDSIIGDGRPLQFRADRADVPGDDTYTFVIELREGEVGAQRQIALYALETDTQVYFCDLDQSASGTDFFWQQTFTTDGSYHSQQSSSLTGPLENGGLFVTLEHQPTRWACITDWPVGQPRLEDGIPGGGEIEPTTISLGVINLEIEILSFFHVHSN